MLQQYKGFWVCFWKGRWRVCGAGGALLLATTASRGGSGGLAASCFGFCRYDGDGDGRLHSTDWTVNNRYTHERVRGAYYAPLEDLFSGGGDLRFFSYSYIFIFWLLVVCGSLTKLVATRGASSHLWLLAAGWMECGDWEREGREAGLKVSVVYMAPSRERRRERGVCVEEQK